MSKKTSPALVGAFVLVAILLALGGIVLFGSKELFRQTYPFVTYFQQSVNGLREGAPVKFKGVEIGTVSEIRLPLANGGQDPPVVVLFSLEGAKIRTSADKEFDPDDLASGIEAGLRVQLAQESFLTGLLYLSIAFVPGAQAEVHDPLPGIPEIPSAPTEFEQLASQVKRFAERLEQVEIEGLANDLHAVVGSIGELLESGRIQSTLASFDETLADVGATSAAVRREIGPLSESLRAAAESIAGAGGDLRATLAEADRTLGSIESLATALEQHALELTRSLDATLLAARAVLDPSSPPLVRLEQALAELGATSRAARSLLDVLERDPAALVRGRSPTEEQR